MTNLGLSAESVFSYHIAEIIRTKDAELPELLPIGYLVGDTMQIGICLKGSYLFLKIYYVILLENTLLNFQMSIIFCSNLG